MKKEELRKVYVAPSESFHQCVVNTLDSLEETPAKHKKPPVERKSIVEDEHGIIILLKDK